MSWPIKLLMATIAGLFAGAATTILVGAVGSFVIIYVFHANDVGIGPPLVFIALGILTAVAVTVMTFRLLGPSGE